MNNFLAVNWINGTAGHLGIDNPLNSTPDGFFPVVKYAGDGMRVTQAPVSSSENSQNYIVCPVHAMEQFQNDSSLWCAALSVMGNVNENARVVKAVVWQKRDIVAEFVIPPLVGSFKHTIEINPRLRVDGPLAVEVWCDFLDGSPTGEFTLNGIGSAVSKSQSP